jgi:hypothetical protein
VGVILGWSTNSVLLIEGKNDRIERVGRRSGELVVIPMGLDWSLVSLDTNARLLGQEARILSFQNSFEHEAPCECKSYNEDESYPARQA